MNHVNAEFVPNVWKSVKHRIVTPFSHSWWPERLHWILYSCKFRIFSQLQVYTTSYKSLVKLLLAWLTRMGKAPNSTIITGFYINKMAFCSLHLEDEGHFWDKRSSETAIQSLLVSIRTPQIAAKILLKFFWSNESIWCYKSWNVTEEAPFIA